MEDPGLSVLPTHRMVRMERKSADEIVASLAPGFEIREIKNGSREGLVAEVLAQMDEKKGQANAFGFYHPSEDRCFLLIMKEGMMDEAGFEKMPEQLKELDVVVLSDLILEKYLGLDHDLCAYENLIDYFSDPDEALDKAVKETNEGDGLSAVFLMNNTEVYQVRNVSDAELVMPHKSTYFYPKILTGLVMNRMIEGEKVDI